MESQCVIIALSIIIAIGIFTMMLGFCMFIVSGRISRREEEEEYRRELEKRLAELEDEG